MTDSITPAETQRALASDDHVAVIDIRPPLEYGRSHIPGSTLVARRRLEFRLPAVVPSRSASVILCDQCGDRAQRDAAWVEFLGYRDVSYIDGGLAAWETAGLDTIEAHEGVHLTAFNYPSKDFGEKVQVQESVEQLQPTELKHLVDRDRDDVVIVDVRTPEEYRRMTIPGALNIEGVDLGLYIDHLRDPDQTVVVHCGGRTRSIIGTASLDKLGVENVYELENGAMGWDLAGYDLEHGADRAVRELTLSDRHRSDIQSRAESLLAETDIPMLSTDDFTALLAAETEVVYPVDVRTRVEYEKGHIPDSLSIPGGQAIQTANDHFAVRNGTIVCISTEHIRAAITAYWLSEMGFPQVTVLKGGLRKWAAAGFSRTTGRDPIPPLQQTRVMDMARPVSVAELAELIATDAPTIVDIDASDRFEHGHIPSARWVPRYHLDDWLDRHGVGPGDRVVLTCRDGSISTYAAAAIHHESGDEHVRVLEGGVSAWADSDRPLETGTDAMAFEPRDQVPKPYQQGDWAKQTYLEWEENLGEKYTDSPGRPE